jgi:hypothetical protein
MSAASRIAALERAARRLYAPQRARYDRDWRRHHEDEATRYVSVISAAENRGVDPEVMAARKRESLREAGMAEAKLGDTQARAAEWTKTRQEILQARARVRKAAEESGQMVVMAAGEPPISPPEWFGRTDGVVTHRPNPAAQAARRNADGTQQLDLHEFDAVAGRKVDRSPPKLTAEEQFANQRKEKDK